MPHVLQERALSAPMVVLSFGIVAGVVVPGEDPISPVLDAGRRHTSRNCA